MPRAFLQTLNYASVNEDWRTESMALRAGPRDAILCLTGSGARPLDLLAEHPGVEVTAIDLNPAQSHLLQLKIAAVRRLDYGDLVAFLGLRAASPRWRGARLKSLLPLLPADTARFWERRTAAVAAGILYQGRWERFYRHVSRLLRVVRGRLIDELFACRDLSAQRALVDRRWDTPGWRRLCAVLCQPAFSRVLLGDPAYWRGVMPGAARYLVERLHTALRSHLARRSFMISLVLRGRLADEDLPPHLTPEGVRRLRPLGDELRVVTGDVREHIGQGGAGFTRFSLSDVGSFLDDQGYAALLRGLSRARPGARFCIREFLRRHPWPPLDGAGLTREPQLETQLAAADRAFAYDFVVGEVTRD